MNEFIIHSHHEMICPPFLNQHYSKDADGLCTRLIRPVAKAGDSFGTVSIQQFRTGGWVISKESLELGELIGKGDFGGKQKIEFASYKL